MCRQLQLWTQTTLTSSIQQSKPDSHFRLNVLPINLCDLLVIPKTVYTPKLLSELRTEIWILCILNKECLFLTSSADDSDTGGLPLEPGKLGIQSGSLILFFFFNRRISASQHCVDLCHISTWISHRHTYVPSLPNLPPISYPICFADPVCDSNCLAVHTVHTVHWTQGRQDTS